MHWVDVRFLPPSTIQNAFDVAEPVILASAPVLQGTMDLLLSTPTIDNANPNADALIGPIEGNSDLYGYTQHEFKTVVVHPWVEGIGQGVGHYRYLSPRNAIDAIAQKLIDQNDDFSPAGKNDYFALFLAGASYAELGSLLERFLVVYSEPTMYMCARRCNQLASLQAQKEKLPEAAVNARWDAVTESSSFRWVDYSKVVGEPYALYVSEEEKSLEEAVGVLAKKKSSLIVELVDKAKFELQLIKNGFGKTLFVKYKTPAEAAKIFRESEVGNVYPISVALIYSGPTDSLNDLYGLFSQ